MTWTVPKDYENRPIVVLGAGVLGRRIAACFAGAGWHVIIFDPSDKSRQAAVDYIRDNISTYLGISHGRQGTWEATADMAAAVKNAWLVFEAVPEVLSLKIDTFHQLEQLAPGDCILASNSSSYKSSELLDKVTDATKQRVLNTHYMMPPQALIVELMTSGSTAEAIFPFLSQELTKVGLKPFIVQRESSGFIFNRIWAAIKREVLAVIAEGVADPLTIDKIWMDLYQSPVGPCVMMDSVGLDTVEHIEQNYVQKRNLPTTTLDWLHDNYIAQGKLGNKSEKGGLYPPAPEGEQTQLLVLNIYQGATPDELAPQQKMSSGQILQVGLADKKSARPTALVTGQAIPDGIAVHGDRMYWTAMGVPGDNDGAVYSARLRDGGDIRTVIPVGKVHTPKQLHIDAVSGKIYFCDREGLRVHRCDLDGSRHEILVQTGDWETEPDKVADPRNWPVGIAVSSRLGRMFWTQKGPSKGFQGRIFSAPLELPPDSTPSTREDIELVASGLPEPIDLAIDEDGEEVVLYWTDRGEIPFGNTLSRKTITTNTKTTDGRVPEAEAKLGREILAQGFGEAIGLCLDKARRRVYVADMAGRLWDCPMDAPGPKEKIYESSGHAYTGIAMYQS
ncbi:uncharacterized protein B0I36DRAFT_338893 [Microdochium trichocladiopsis]|uniref:3-hydroxyacyl-CoA dehydrogenase n=1 Tax=Microdochium trichocladiopsis TaxID=1682393 RepID=A0A9P8XSQ7_9PEZI|nr:uncharacterized protein B0I36DRAFT_338893 [Microdochium trichocladiopsis]KAH7014561.1 hypothetical protein B0I36DRAFT_338893 [Microdochium trichocladiopsis]